MGLLSQGAIDALIQEALIDEARKKRIEARYYRLMVEHRDLSHEELLLMAIQSVIRKHNKYPRD